MANIGFSELLVIFMILVLVFGASRLPALGETVGKTVRSFRRGVAENQDIDVTCADKLEADANVSDAELVDENAASPAAKRDS